MRWTLSLLALAAAVSAGDVVDLKKPAFDSFVAADLSLVKFYAPWCGHCKALAPEYEQAATALKADGIALAEIDCTIETDLCSSFQIGGYPTLKVFRRGEHSDYGGSRKADGIVSYMKKQALPAVSEVSAATHDAFKDSDKIVVIGYFGEKDAESKAAFTEFAESHRDDYLFGLAPESAADAKVETPAVVLYKKFDEGRNDLPGPATFESLDSFLRSNSVPLLDEISPENFASYADSGLPLAYIFVESTDAKREEIVEAIKPVAQDAKGKINFVWIDALKFADHGKSLNLVEPVWPAFAIQNIQQMTKYPLAQTGVVDFKTVSDFVSDYLAGKLSPSIKSAKIPEVQDEPVYVLVADEFDKVVNSDVDAFVEFYAPWCGHCQNLKPTWDKLGEKYADVKSKLVIAKFDATENDVPASTNFRITGFPTIKFKPAGSSEWISYDGDRSFDSLVEFVEANAANDLSATAADSKAKRDEPEVVPVEEEKKAGHDEL